MLAVFARFRIPRVASSGLAGEVHRRAPVRQRLRHAFVGRPQRGALREQLRIVVVGVGEAPRSASAPTAGAAGKQQRRDDASDAADRPPRSDRPRLWHPSRLRHPPLKTRRRASRQNPEAAA